MFGKLQREANRLERQYTISHECRQIIKRDDTLTNTLRTPTTTTNIFTTK